MMPLEMVGPGMEDRFSTTPTSIAAELLLIASAPMPAGQRKPTGEPLTPPFERCTCWIQRSVLQLL